MKKYKEFKIKFTPFEPELVAGILWDFEITGVNEEKDYIVVFADESSPVNLLLISNMMEKLKTESLVQTFSIEENLLEDRNWNEEWEKTLNVIEVDEKIVIKPTFREYSSKPGQIIINIDPKMSFGTGEHQTTKIMIKLIEKYVRQGDKVLDVGSGTGVLAIASLKLGAEKAVAIDNDEWCLMNGLENSRLNDVEDILDVRHCELAETENAKYDLILANINKNILKDIKEDIKLRLGSDGTLILSGLLFSDENDIRRHYEPIGFKMVEKLQMDEWIGIVFKWV